MRPIDDSDFYGGKKNMIYNFTISDYRRQLGTARFEIIDCPAEKFHRIKYMIEDKLNSIDLLSTMRRLGFMQIKKVIFNNPATIIIWSDGSKTVVKVQNGEEYDPEKGMALCCAKKLLGNKSNFNNEFKKWLSKEDQNDS